MNETIKRLDKLADEVGTVDYFGTELALVWPKIRAYIGALEKKAEAESKEARAGKVLAENVQRMGLHSGKQRKEWRAERDAALDTYNQAIKE